MFNCITYNLVGNAIIDEQHMWIILLIPLSFMFAERNFLLKTDKHEHSDCRKKKKNSTE